MHCHFSLKKMLKAQSIKSQEVHYIEYFLRHHTEKGLFPLWSCLHTCCLPLTLLPTPGAVRWRPREIVGNCKRGQEVSDPEKAARGNPIVAGCWRSGPGQKGLGLRVLRAGLLGTGWGEMRAESSLTQREREREKERKEERVRWGLKIQREAKERNEIQGMLKKPQGQNKKNERIKERNRINSDCFSHPFNEM